MKSKCLVSLLISFNNIAINANNYININNNKGPRKGLLTVSQSNTY